MPKSTKYKKINELLGTAYAKGLAEAELKASDCRRGARFVAGRLKNSTNLSQYHSDWVKLLEQVEQNLECPKQLTAIANKMSAIEKQVEACEAAFKQAGLSDALNANRQNWGSVKKNTIQTLKAVGSHAGIYLAIEQLLEVMHAAIEFLKETLLSAVVIAA